MDMNLVRSIEFFRIMFVHGHGSAQALTASQSYSVGSMEMRCTIISTIVVVPRRIT